MAEVVWTDQATAQLEQVDAYIRQFNPVAADRLIARLLRLTRLLETSPEMGRPISRGRRQLASVRPYLIRYRVAGNFIYIDEVRHGARRPDR